MKKKVRLFGPGFPRYRLQLFNEAVREEELDGLTVLAQTLSDVLEEYAKAINASIRPYDGSLERVPFEPNEAPKFFFLESVNEKIGSSLIDIHIERDGQYICAKQNILFELKHGDIVLIDRPAC